MWRKNNEVAIKREVTESKLQSKSTMLELNPTRSVAESKVDFEIIVSDGSCMSTECNTMMWRGRYGLECRYIQNQVGFRSIWSKYVCIQPTRSVAESKVDLDIIASDGRSMSTVHNPMIWRGRYGLECHYFQNQVGFRSIWTKYVCIQSTRSVAESKVDLDIIASDGSCMCSEHNPMMWRGRYGLECRYIQNQVGFRSIWTKYVCIQSTRSVVESKVDLDIIVPDGECMCSVYNLHDVAGALWFGVSLYPKPSWFWFNLDKICMFSVDP